MEPYIQQYLPTLIGFFVLGYGIVKFITWIVPRKLRSENGMQREELLKAARDRGQLLKDEAAARDERRFQLSKEELEEQIKDHKEDLLIEEQDLDARERYAETEEARLKHMERDIENAKAKVSTLEKAAQLKAEEYTQQTNELRLKLQEVSGSQAEQLKSTMKQSFVEARQLECQKLLKTLADDLNTASKRNASRMLSRTLARYAPEFPWPKATNHVEIDAKTLEILSTPENTLLADIKSLAEVEVELLPGNQQGGSPIIKLAGGSGILREAARLALNEVIHKNSGGWAKIAGVYEKQRQALLSQALTLGKKAVEELQLDGMHPEILTLVGSLNWRTSYRQNQYLHTVEVAKLAGIIASEIGVDPEQAKRSGLLHDIGKCLDYRIEGSHAVISGDYADRFGESRVICDTVMSHHNDLVLETPLSFVLKSADTLSGARPGARVNLEEGYQDRLSGIDEVVRSFPGVSKSLIMNGGREVHVDVHHKKINDADLESLTTAIAKKIEKDVAFPGQIKVLVTRRFEAVSVA